MTVPKDIPESTEAATPRAHRPSLVVNAASSWAAFAVTVIAGFLLTPFIITHLGKDGYGIWCLVGSVIGYYGLLDLGVSSAVRRYVARYAAQADHQALNETVSTALALFVGAGMLMIAASLLAGGPLGRFFHVAAQTQAEFSRVVMLLGVAAAANIVGQVFRATIAAHEYFVARNVVTVIATALRAGLTVATLRLGWGLGGVAVSYLIVDVARLLLYLRLIQQLTPSVRPRPRYLRWKRARSLLAFGLTMTAIIGAGIVQIHMASIIIARCIGLEAVAVYAVAALLMRYFSNLIHAGLGVLSPRFAGLDGLHDRRQFRELMVKGLWASSLLSCAVGLGLLILGERFLHLWVGDRFTAEEFGVAVTVLTVLSISYTVALSQTPGATALYAMNRHRVYAGIMVLEAGFNMMLSIALVQRYGVVGVALGTLIALGVTRTLAQPVYISRVAGMALLDYIRPLALSTSAAALVWWLWHAVLWPRTPTVGYVGLMVAGVCITVTYAAAVAVLIALTDLARGRPLRVGISAARSVRVDAQSPGD